MPTLPKLPFPRTTRRLKSEALGMSCLWRLGEALGVWDLLFWLSTDFRWKGKGKSNQSCHLTHSGGGEVPHFLHKIVEMKEIDGKNGYLCYGIVLLPDGLVCRSCRWPPSPPAQEWCLLSYSKMSRGATCSTGEPSNAFLLVRENERRYPAWLNTALVLYF